MAEEGEATVEVAVDTGVTMVVEAGAEGTAVVGVVVVTVEDGDIGAGTAVGVVTMVATIPTRDTRLDITPLRR